MFERKPQGPEDTTLFFLDIDNARAYAEQAERDAGRMYRALLRDLTALDVRGKCLDAGCGPGVATCLFADRVPGIHITAFDVAPNLVASAREHTERRSLADRVQFVVGDAQDSEWMAGLGRFDLVYCSYVLHGWEDPRPALRNLWGAVEDGGCLLIHDLVRVWWLCLLPSGGFLAEIRASFTPSELGAMLEEVGIVRYELKKSFPFMMSAIARK